MHQDMLEDEGVLSDTQSSASSSRRNSLISSHMTVANPRSRRGSTTGRESLVIDSNENKQPKQPTPVKVLVVNGKCSEIFKSTLEDCVEDCILEFPGQTPIYVPKAGQAIQKLVGNKANANYGSRESSFHQSARTNRRRSSITQFTLPQISGTRSNQTNNFSLSTAAITATSATRLRHPLVQQKFSLAEDITEETTDHPTVIEDPIINEIDSEHPPVSQEERQSPSTNLGTVSPSFLPPHRKLPSASVYSSYRSRQKDFRLSDLVMRGPEYYADIFNLSRISRYGSQTASQQRNKTNDQYSELDRIKQDLFHRYLWTQKPQVSCRIRPISTYTRSTTIVL